MPIISFNEKDLLRGKLVTPAWYRVHIEKVGEKPAKEKPGVSPSTNYPIEGTILFNADNGDKEFAGVPTPESWQFNSKAMGFAVGFLNSLGVQAEAGKRYDLAAAEGKDIDVYIENDTYDNRLVNRINHKYRAPQDVQA